MNGSSYGIGDTLMEACELGVAAKQGDVLELTEDDETIAYIEIGTSYWNSVLVGVMGVVQERMGKLRP
jgi:hypothetical protein